MCKTFGYQVYRRHYQERCYHKSWCEMDQSNNPEEFEYGYTSTQSSKIQLCLQKKSEKKLKFSLKISFENYH